MLLAQLGGANRYKHLASRPGRGSFPELGRAWPRRVRYEDSDSAQLLQEEAVIHSLDSGA